MQADFSVELGGAAPALEIPWRSNDPCVHYYDLKKHLELVQKIPEAAAYPELGVFLSRINVPEFPLATAKCDAWLSTEISPEEEIFGDRKFVSYVDLVFVDESERCSFAKHEAFAKELCRLLGQAPEIAATVELVIRHCYYHQQKVVSENEAAQVSPLSRSVKDYGMGSTGNEDTSSHGEQTDVTLCGENTDIALQEKSARVTNPSKDVTMIQGGPAKAFDDGEPGNEMRHIELSKVTDQDDEVIVPNHGEFAAFGERKQSAAQELEGYGSSYWDDPFKAEPLSKTEQSDKAGRSGTGQSDKTEGSGKTERSGKGRPTPTGESGNVQLEPRLEPKLNRDEINSSVTGFCLTAYVTGFGDCEHDPLRRWMIGLNLLQHAIVQLNSTFQPKR